uniref:Putative zinc-finger domain-containing protein n=1 Tax=Thermosporothrix sp. COM3 TaxID=2490863 RepID=A0A455SL59_9CHLR|nr:hypothetical protein KTC_24500 [Thermosporothrix sp. COM3]
MIEPYSCEQSQGLLPWFITGKLTEGERQRLMSHLKSCSVCQEELKLWRGFAADVTELYQRTQPEVVQPFTPSWNSFSQRLSGEVQQTSLLAHWMQKLHSIGERGVALVTFQLLLTPGEVWIVQGAAFFLMLLLTVVPLPLTVNTQLLQFLMVLQAVICFPLLFREREHMEIELLPTTVTSPRLLLLCRLLVYGIIQLGLNGGVTLLFSMTHVLSLSGFLMQWLGPLCFMVAVAFFLSTVVRPLIALPILIVLWSARMLAWFSAFRYSTVSLAIEHFWSSGPLLAIGTLCLLLGTLFLARRERFM